MCSATALEKGFVPPCGIYALLAEPHDLLDLQLRTVILHQFQDPLLILPPPRVGGVEIVGRFDAGGQHGDQFQVAVAMFCREKVWWNNSELVMEELFVRPECQRQGFGTALLQKAEEYVIDKGLAGITLVTNRCAPAPAFYKKNGFAEYGHVLYMGKEAQPRPDNQPS